MEYYNSYDPYELTHWGIKGMKWGVRRFQNKDGSLTEKGGKRYNGADYQPRKSLGQKISDYKKTAKRKANLKKAREARAAKQKAAEEAKLAAEQRKKDVAAGKIRATDMTNEELQARIDRLNSEKRYKQLMEETDQTSKMVSYGKQFAKKMWDQAIVPAATEAGKQIVKDALIKASKGDAKIEEFDLDKFWKNRNKMTSEQIADVNKRLQNEAQIKKRMDNLKEEEQAAKKDKMAKKQAMKDYKEFQKKEKQRRENPSPTPESTTYNTRDNKTEYHNRRDYVDPSKEPRASNPPSVKKSLNDSQTKSEKTHNNKTETYTGTVEGEGTSRFTGWDKDPFSKKGAKTVKYTTIDPGTDIVVSGKKYASNYSSKEPSQKYIASGKNVITALIEDKK